MESGLGSISNFQHLLWSIQVLCFATQQRGGHPAATLKLLVQSLYLLHL